MGKLKYEPCPMEWMQAKSGIYTFCEVLREIYQMAEKIEESEIKDAIQLRARVATSMVKEIANKIKQYEPLYLTRMYGTTKEAHDNL